MHVFQIFSTNYVCYWISTVDSDSGLYCQLTKMRRTHAHCPPPTPGSIYGKEHNDLTINNSFQINTDLE